MIRVLFVCMGNICRSPIAHGVLEQLLHEHELAGDVAVDSAGTHAYHVGEPPDARARSALHERGIDIGGQRARRVCETDFAEYHYILAMDRDNVSSLVQQCPPRLANRIRLLLDYAPGIAQREVPDPYYGGPDGFEKVIDLVELAIGGLIEELGERVAKRDPNGES